MREKKKWRHRAAWMLTLTLILGLMPVMAVTAGASSHYIDGTYEGSGTGYGGAVTVSLTIQDGKMTALTSPSHEGESFWDRRNVDSLLTAILEANRESIVGVSGVDSVSGATRSSQGVKEAVTDALSKAVDAAFFDSGEGTEKNPYVIATSDQLKSFAASVDEGTAYEGEYIRLGADLDLSGSQWNPIGAETGTDNIFNGDFDGQGHTVSGLTIREEKLPSEMNAGLFSTLGSKANVKNLHLTGVDIEISSEDSVLRTGAIAGDTVNGVNSDAGVGTWLDNCSAQGSVKAETEGAKLVFCGGLVGRGNIITTITNCWTDVNIDGSSRGGNQSAYAGGILGTSGNNAKVINCASFGNTKAVSPKSTNFGGMAGGIAAMFAGKAWNVTASGNVVIGNGGSAHKWIGALFGENTTTGMTRSGSEYIYPEKGALRDFGYFSESLTLTIEKYVASTGEYESTETADLVPAGTGNLAHDTVFAASENVRAEAEMNTQAFADTMNANLKAVTKLMDAFGMEGLQLREWELTDDRVLPTGEFWVNKEPDSSIFDSGSGTESDPYIIMTLEQMKAFAGSLTDGINYEGYSVQLGADIDISGENWTPVGGSDYAFNGTFDGNGHRISGMTEGSEEEPLQIDYRESPYMGFFGVLDSDAVVRDLKLTDVAVYLKADRSFYLGGLAGFVNGRASESGSKGARIDNVSVSGTLQGTAGQGNEFVGGIAGYLHRAALINSWTDVDVYAEVLEGSAVAEAGGLVALNNRGLVANSYTLGNVAGKVSRENGAEGAPSVGGLVGVNGGSMANCYSRGNNTGTGLGAVYNGAVTGWITGTGSTYGCWYNKDSTMTADGKVLPEVAAIGTKVPAGVNDEGDAYIGGLADDNNGYTMSSYETIVENMNSRFAKFPVDLEKFGLEASALKNWVYDTSGKLVTFGDTNAAATYVQPAVEIVPEPELIPEDGIWFGRSVDQSSVVRITVADHQVTAAEALSGDSSGAAYEEAYQKALEKATYGDTSDYAAPDADRFAGGNGSEQSPYLISDEQQLRYVAEALNEDNSWEDVYFRQTADIDVSSKEWLPIGWGIRTTVIDREKQYCVYPFEGHYDGDGHTVSGLTIGSAETPTADIRAQYLAGLFGLISGDCPDNGAVDGRRLAEVKNLHVQDAIVNVSSRYQNYSGTLIGFAQSGFVVDNTSATGTVKSYSQDSFARGGGLIASSMRGLVSDSWADTTVEAGTDMGHVYAGGLYGMDNRVATINSYALGDVTADAGYTNRIHIGGLIGQAGGIHYNCYAAGDVIAKKDCTDVGGLNGRSAGINVEQECFWNSDAIQKINNTAVEEKAGNGAEVSSHPNTVYARSLAELSSQDFADLLNANKGKMPEINEALKAELVSDSAEGTLTQPYYYEGDGSDLNEWMEKTGSTVVFKEAAEENHQDNCPSKPFKDVDTGLWYHEGIDYAVEKGMMNGVAEDAFDPEGTTTRAMIVTILYRLEGEPAAEASTFTDLKEDSWYEDAVNWAAANGIVNGYDEKTFGPDDAITREQMAKILYKYAEYKGKDLSASADLSSFTDNGSVSGYAKEAMAWAVGVKLINGVTETTLEPQGKATRAQVATLMMRLCENVLKTYPHE